MFGLHTSSKSRVDSNVYIVHFLATVKFKFKKVAIIEERWYIYIVTLICYKIKLPGDLRNFWQFLALHVHMSWGIDLEWRNVYNYFKVHLYCPNIVNLLCTQICDFYGDNLCLENKWRQDVKKPLYKTLYKVKLPGLCSIHYKNDLLENSNSLIIQNKIFNKFVNRGVWFQHLKNLGT